MSCWPTQISAVVVVVLLATQCWGVDIDPWTPSNLQDPASDPSWTPLTPIQDPALVNGLALIDAVTFEAVRWLCGYVTDPMEVVPASALLYLLHPAVYDVVWNWQQVLPAPVLSRIRYIFWRCLCYEGHLHGVQATIQEILLHFASTDFVWDQEPPQVTLLLDQILRMDFHSVIWSDILPLVPYFDEILTGYGDVLRCSTVPITEVCAGDAHWLAIVPALGDDLMAAYWDMKYTGQLIPVLCYAKSQRMVQKFCMLSLLSRQQQPVNLVTLIRECIENESQQGEFTVEHARSFVMTGITVPSLNLLELIEILIPFGSRPESYPLHDAVVSASTPQMMTDFVQLELGEEIQSTVLATVGELMSACDNFAQMAGSVAASYDAAAMAQEPAPAFYPLPPIDPLDDIADSGASTTAASAEAATLALELDQVVLLLADQDVEMSNAQHPDVSGAGTTAMLDSEAAALELFVQSCLTDAEEPLESQLPSPEDVMPLPTLATELQPPNHEPVVETYPTVAGVTVPSMDCNVFEMIPSICNWDL